MNQTANETILVLDFGGKQKELVARAVRSLNVYSELRPGTLSAEEIRRINPIGIILTGGTGSACQPNSPKCDPAIFTMGIPVLGICYGMQMMVHMLGGAITQNDTAEYGRVAVAPLGSQSALFSATRPFMALMNHKDSVTHLPTGFVSTAASSSGIAVCENSDAKLYGVQFHPQASHTDGGMDILRSFLYGICGATGQYQLDNYIDTQISQIREAVGDKKILLALSGGVDSSVCAALLTRAVPGQLTCIFVDHGFMRLDEGDHIEAAFAGQDLNFIRINAQERFLSKISGISDPEAKRKLIGNEFIYVFEEEAKKLGHIPFFAQGTIYADIVESGGEYGAVIKSHHNVGGLPEKLGFTKIIEPLAGLFKDEVRILGRKLGLPPHLTERQPFPGPGLAIRVIGAVTHDKLEILRHADAIATEEIGRLNPTPSQYFAVMTDTRSVGIKGDDRTYDHVIAIRAVTTDDFMTCEYTPIPHDILRRIAARITDALPNVSRVVYDITSKPPATIEWE
ncbi:MAG: glutamine-hydrolyzing GMP synthase [Defluviitaleaceae bacterium]|nr:glutamine-hydrolyzing GMP synthase [Defluviitaleaceae bacterium]